MNRYRIPYVSCQSGRTLNFCQAARNLVLTHHAADVTSNKLRVYLTWHEPTRMFHFQFLRKPVSYDTFLITIKPTHMTFHPTLLLRQARLLSNMRGELTRQADGTFTAHFPLVEDTL